MLDLDRISPNPSQPREHFEEGALRELARSLKEQGCLQPVVVRVRSADGGFELIAGERRWRAAQIAGLLKIPAIVREVPDEKLLELALVENLQRENLNPIEAARAYRSLIDDMKLTQREVAERVGKERATIANALRLLNLPIEVQGKIEAGQLSAGHAKALASIADADLQRLLAERIVREGLSVRQVEATVSAALAGSSKKAPVRPEKDPNVEAAEQALRVALGAPVKIHSGKDGGRIEIVCRGADELRRIYDQIMSTSKQ
jgi:ParB family chromosome partitioning protein